MEPSPGYIRFKHRQVTDLNVTDLGFSGPRIPFCATGALWGRVTPFSDHFSKPLSSVLGRTVADRALSRGPESHHFQERKSSLNIKFLGGIFLGHPGPRRRDIPDKNFMQVAFFCCFRQGVAGMSRALGRDVPDLEKLCARKLWADFSYPPFGTIRSVSKPLSQPRRSLPQKVGSAQRAPVQSALGEK